MLDVAFLLHIASRSLLPLLSALPSENWHFFWIPELLLSTGASARQNAAVSCPHWLLLPGRWRNSI
jgi:hypothetical protein